MPNYQRIVWIGLAVTAVAILALGYFLFLAPAGEKKEVSVPETASLPQSQAPQGGAEAEAAEPAVVPLDLDLDASDGAIRSLAAADCPPLMGGWLNRKDLARTAVAAIDAIARGESPAGLLAFMAPADGFPVFERGGKSFMDPRGFRRYDPLVGAFAAVPDATWIRWYRTLSPTLEKAFRELGYPGLTFAQRLRQAIEHLLQAPRLDRDIELERKVVSYAFADPALEELSAAQKHMLRLGPANAARIQKKLRALAAALGAGGKN